MKVGDVRGVIVRFRKGVMAEMLDSRDNSSAGMMIGGPKKSGPLSG